MEDMSRKRKVGRPLNSGKYGSKTQVIRVPQDRIAAITHLLQSGSASLPLYGSKVPAGSPMLADDFIEDLIDLNTYFVKKPASTFLIRVSGESMIKAGIFAGDILIVDHALEATHGKIVVAALDEGLTVKRLYRKEGVLRLLPENDDYSPIEVNGDLVIWGVVRHVIHSYAE